MLRYSYALLLCVTVFSVTLTCDFGHAEELLFSILTPEEDLSGFLPLNEPSGESWYDSPFWGGPEFARIGAHWMHPGGQKDVARTFRVPRDGRIRITGNMRKLHLDGDGVIATMHHDYKEFWRVIIGGKDDIGADFEEFVDVKKEDCIRFRINKRGDLSCDTTAWDPLIEYVDGNKERFIASEGFSTRQGEQHWFYEMEGEAMPPSPKLTIHLDSEQEYRRIAGTISRTPDFELFSLVLAEWLEEDRFHNTFTVMTWEYACPWAGWKPDDLQEYKPLYKLTSETLLGCVDAQLKRTQELMDQYGALFTQNFEEESTILADLKESFSRLNGLNANASEREIQELYIRSRLLKRSVFFSNPEFSSDKILFVKRRNPSYTHLVNQYYGWRQRPGGGMYVLERPGYSSNIRDVIGDALPTGSFLEPRLSYDAQKIAFSYVQAPEFTPNAEQLPVNEEGDNAYYFHLYEVDINGNNLTQLTCDQYDDLMPEYLPDGGLAFVSTRRKTYGRCFGTPFSKRWHCYTLFRMNRNERDLLNPNDIQQISFNDVNEWFPAISPSGLLTFARWDYIDRDAVTHQNLWAMRPDGTNPVAVWGNAAPVPHCMFQAKAIPNTNQFVFVGSAHHSITGGPVAVVDPSIDINSMDAIKRITPGKFPEAESMDIPEYYNSPYPLSEKLFLVAFSPGRLAFEGVTNFDNALGLYLLDDLGNREVLYRDPDIGSTSPLPIAARPVPPVIPTAMDPSLAEAGLGEMSIADVYEGLEDVERGTLKELRIVQIFPKSTWIVNEPRIGAAGEENARAILGVVPIEEDGSAKFLVPSGKPILFQALDADGFAYQTMRSTTSVMPGEQVSCVGCHEDRMQAPRRFSSTPTAFSRPASQIKPTWDSGRPYGFVEMVQPILDSKCISCHGGTDETGTVNLTGKLDLTRAIEGAFTRSYHALCPIEENGYLLHNQDPTQLLVPRFVERNQIQMTAPGGAYGARGSRLIKLLREGHEGVVLTPEELKSLITWIDLNAVFYGDYDSKMTEHQRLGLSIPMPEIQ